MREQGVDGLVVDSLEILALPVVPQPARHAGIEHPLEVEVWHAPDEIRGGANVRAQRMEDLVGIVTDAAHHNEHHGFPVQLGRKVRNRGSGAKAHDRRQVFGSRRDIVAVQFEELPALLPGVH
jgi:hypothetical protein